MSQTESKRDEEKLAFVLMPFDEGFSPIYEKIIKPALEHAGYTVKRADSFIDQHNILKEIVRGISRATLIIAELTTLNPNVLYELGLSHGLRIPTVMLAQSMDDVPFDLRSYKVLTYSLDFDKVTDLSDNLREIGTKHLDNQVMFSSPIIDFLPGSAAVKVEDKLVGVSSTDIAVEMDELDEPGFLDFMVDVPQALKSITEIMSFMAAQTVDIGSKMGSRSVEIDRLTSKSGPEIPRQIHKVTLAAARDMRVYAERIGSKIAAFEENTDQIIDTYTYYLARLKKQGKVDIEDTQSIRDNLAMFHSSSNGTLEGVKSFRDSVAGLAGISREINRASRGLTTKLDRVLASLEKIRAFSEKTLPLIDEVLEEADAELV